MQRNFTPADFNFDIKLGYSKKMVQFAFTSEEQARNILAYLQYAGIKVSTDSTYPDGIDTSKKNDNIFIIRLNPQSFDQYCQLPAYGKWRTGNTGLHQAVFKDIEHAKAFRDKLYKANISATSIANSSSPFVESSKNGEFIVRYNNTGHSLYLETCDNFEKFKEREQRYEQLLNKLANTIEQQKISSDTADIIKEEIKNQNKTWKTKANDIYTRVKDHKEGKDSVFGIITAKIREAKRKEINKPLIDMVLDLKDDMDKIEKGIYDENVSIVDLGNNTIDTTVTTTTTTTTISEQPQLFVQTIDPNQQAFLAQQQFQFEQQQQALLAQQFQQQAAIQTMTPQQMVTQQPWQQQFNPQFLPQQQFMSQQPFFVNQNINHSPVLFNQNQLQQTNTNQPQQFFTNTMGPNGGF